MNNNGQKEIKLYGKLSGKKVTISDINLESIRDLGKLGFTMVKETRKDSDGFDYDLGTTIGKYIYVKNDDPTRGLIIYRDFIECLNLKNGHNLEADNIAKLQLKQPDIKLTQFPTGTVSIGDVIIGEQIPFYNGYVHIDEYVRQSGDFQSVIDCGVKLIDIIKELYDNEVSYTDICSKNVMVDPVTNDVKLIDFDVNSSGAMDLNYAYWTPANVKYEDLKDDNYNRSLSRLIHLLKDLALICGVNLDEQLNNDISSFEELRSIFAKTERRLIKK